MAFTLNEADCGLSDYHFKKIKAHRVRVRKLLPVPETKISSRPMCIGLAKSFTKPMCSVAGKNFFKAPSDCGWEHGEGWLARKEILINGRTLATNFPSVTDTKPLQVPKINYRADVFVTSWKLIFREVRSKGGDGQHLWSAWPKKYLFYHIPN